MPPKTIGLTKLRCEMRGVALLADSARQK
ncbi:hypothetical protein ABID08_000410 [Rhizobium binae]|uniref:Uncharacterized protein n=1 Tax=Rhizobium binae TaxID=1138190 RepID=A0ABV2M9K0_9HYPH